MKLTLSFDKKSINELQKTLRNVKKQLTKDMLDDFFESMYKYFVDRANTYVILSDIGELVKNEIQSSWSYIREDNRIKITNIAEKAVYVEFGVGVEGQEDPHPNASVEGYEYNVKSGSKLVDGAWLFKSYEDEIDIPTNAIISKDYTASGQLRILTLGTKGTMYAFNALEDLRANTYRLWEEIKVKYWG